MSDGEDVLTNLSTSSLPTAIPICLRGFPNKEDAETTGNLVAVWLRGFGLYFDLSEVEGLTIAYDYDVALAEFDRGFPASRPEGRTNDQFGIGVAKTVPVFRDGKVKSHIFIHAEIANWLKDSHPEHKKAQYLIAHEAAHAEEAILESRRLRDSFLRQKLRHEDAQLFEIAHACWSEYAACRMAAWVRPEETEPFEATFCEALSGLRERGNRAILKYRSQGNIVQLLKEIVGDYGGVAKYGAYLLGHLAGLKETTEQSAPRAYALIRSEAYFAPLYEELSNSLEILWDSRESWDGLKVFDPLMAFSRRLLRIGGLELSMRPEGLYVDVP